jgi:signal transduction histidine kinase
MNEPSEKRPSTDFLDELEAAFLAADALPQRWTTLDHARARAEVLGRRGTGAAGRQLAVIVFLAEALAASTLEEPWSTADFRSLMETGARVSGLRIEVVETATYLLLVRDPGLLRLPPRLSLDVQLRLLCLFTGSEEVSLWEAAPEGVTCVAAIGASPGGRARAEARRTIDEGTERRDPRARIRGFPVAKWPHSHAALVVRLDPAESERAMPLVAEMAGVLSVILERDSLVKRGASREQALVAFTERRFARLGFDLHDGPLQDVSALAAEIRHFRKQIPRLLDDAQPVELALGRIDDIEARLVALDSDLRELARSFESPAVLKRPFAEAVRAEVNALTRSTKIEGAARLEGDFHRLTDSQRIALFRIVQEALSNVREHSGATTVRVSISAQDGGAELEIVDDGRGFEVEPTLIRAAKQGHLGVVGMNERARLLGGAFNLHSVPGGPTRITVSLPPWQPLERHDSEQASWRAADLG